MSIRRARSCIALGLSAILWATTAMAQRDCRLLKGKVAGGSNAIFAPDRVTVDVRPRSLLTFETMLPVTSDGALDSYGPDDLGPRRGINSLCNAVTVYRTNSAGDRLGALNSVTECGKLLSVFRAFRNAGWNDPPSFEVDWRGGLAASVVDDREIPCTFDGGTYNGFFGSKTNLKNGLQADLASDAQIDLGQCYMKDQIDPRAIPGITIQGGRNFIRDSGVQLGDLAVASIRERDGRMRHVPAIVVDSGGVRYPAMGTIALNAALLQKAGPFETASAVQSLQTPKDHPVRVTIVPGSFGYHLARPYTAANIGERWQAFLHGAGVGSMDELLAKETCSR